MLSDIIKYIFSDCWGGGALQEDFSRYYGRKAVELAGSGTQIVALAIKQSYMLPYQVAHTSLYRRSRHYNRDVYDLLYQPFP